MTSTAINIGLSAATSFFAAKALDIKPKKAIIGTVTQVSTTILTSTLAQSLGINPIFAAIPTTLASFWIAKKVTQYCFGEELTIKEQFKLGTMSLLIGLTYLASSGVGLFAAYQSLPNDIRQKLVTEGSTALCFPIKQQLELAEYMTMSDKASITALREYIGGLREEIKEYENDIDTISRKNKDLIAQNDALTKGLTKYSLHHQELKDNLEQCRAALA